MKIQLIYLFLLFFVVACNRNSEENGQLRRDPLPPGFVEVACECPQPEKIVIVGGRGPSQEEAEKNALKECQEITPHTISSVESCEDGPLEILRKKLREHHKRVTEQRQKKDSSE